MGEFYDKTIKWSGTGAYNKVGETLTEAQAQAAFRTIWTTELRHVVDAENTAGRYIGMEKLLQGGTGYDFFHVGKVGVRYLNMGESLWADENRMPINKSTVFCDNEFATKQPIPFMETVRSAHNVRPALLEEMGKAVAHESNAKAYIAAIKGARQGARVIGDTGGTTLYNGTARNDPAVLVNLLSYAQGLWDDKGLTGMPKDLLLVNSVYQMLASYFVTQNKDIGGAGGISTGDAGNLYGFRIRKEIALPSSYNSGSIAYDSFSKYLNTTGTTIKGMVNDYTGDYRNVFGLAIAGQPLVKVYAKRPTVEVMLQSSGDYGKLTRADWLIVSAMDGYGVMAPNQLMEFNALQSPSDEDDINVDTLLTGIAVSPTTANIAPAGTQQLTVTKVPANSDAATSYTYKSSDATKATVSSSGLVTGVAHGSATITVTDSHGYTATCVVTVATPMTGISVSPDTASLAPAGTQQLTVTKAPSGTSENPTYTYASSDSTVATVSNAGLITAVANGSATITVTSSNGFTDTCAVTVATGG